MTTTDKRTVRVTKDSFRVLYNKARPIVVIVERDKIGFREKGRRGIFWLPIEDAFRWSVRNEANRVRAEKRAKRKGLVAS